MQIWTSSVAYNRRENVLPRRLQQNHQSKSCTTSTVVAKASWIDHPLKRYPVVPTVEIIDSVNRQHHRRTVLKSFQTTVRVKVFFPAMFNHRS